VTPDGTALFRRFRFIHVHLVSNRFYPVYHPSFASTIIACCIIIPPIGGFSRARHFNVTSALLEFRSTFLQIIAQTDWDI